MYIFMYKHDMHRRFSIAEARASLPSIIDDVGERGPVEITRRGKPIAVVLSLADYERLAHKRTTFSEAYAAFRAAHDLAECGVDADFAPRDRSTGRAVDL